MEVTDSEFSKDFDLNQGSPSSQLLTSTHGAASNYARAPACFSLVKRGGAESNVPSDG